MKSRTCCRCGMKKRQGGINVLIDAETKTGASGKRAVFICHRCHNFDPIRAGERVPIRGGMALVKTVIKGD